LESSREAVALAQKHDHLWATVGLHPNYTQKEDFNTTIYGSILREPKVVGVGECGLDYFRQSTTQAGDEAKAGWKEKQWEVFKQHVALAVEHDKPLMIHCRPSKGSMDAYEEVADYFESLMGDVRRHPLRGMPQHQERFPHAEHAPTSGVESALLPNAQSDIRSHSRQSRSLVRGNMHFFVGNVKIAKRFWRLGFTTSFTGVLTFTHDYDEVVREAPLDMILTETDAPYAAPTPHRGKRNEPVYVQYVAKAISALRGESEYSIQCAVLHNAHRMFGVGIKP